MSNERWGARKEAMFFDELAATNNVSRAAKAAGVSYNAVLARRLKHPLFAAKWEAVARTARATIDMHLLEETQKSFDPAEMNISDAKPRVTIDQAIKISQIGAAKSRQAEPDDHYKEMADDMAPDQVDEVKERILRKLQRLRQRDMPEQLAAGWSYDEEYDLMVPPGWVRAVPNEEGEPSPE